MMSTCRGCSSAPGLSARRKPFALGRIVIHQVGDLEDRPVGRLHQLEAGCGIGALPLAQFLDDVFDLFDLVLVLSRELTFGMWTIVFSAGSSTFRMSSV